jgi:hypothetical protein
LPKIEVVFGSYYTSVWLHGQVFLISSYFSTIPGWVGAGRADAGYIKNKANLSPVELYWGLAELGKNVGLFSCVTKLNAHNAYCEMLKPISHLV